MEKFNFNTKLNEVCSKDELRPVMNCIHFSGGFAYASDGAMAIRQSLEYHSLLNPENLDGKSLHRESYKNIMSFEIAEANEDGIICKDKDGRTAFFDYFNMQGQQQPNVEKVINDFKAKGVTFIGFNPEKLYKLSKAMYSPDKQFKFDFGGVDSIMYVTVPGVDNQDAIIMPLIINDTLF